MGRSAPARTQTIMCRWRTGSPVECTQEIQACHDPSRSWRSQHSRCPTGPPVSSTIGGDAGLRPYGPPSRSTTVSAYETKFERGPNGGDSRGSMGEERPGDDRAPVHHGRREAGGPRLPPDLQCQLLANGDIIGQTDCGRELGKPSPGPAEHSQSSVPGHRAKLGRSQRSGRFRPTCPPRPDGLRGSPMTPRGTRGMHVRMSGQPSFWACLQRRLRV
jgi:hypothetical protein